MIGRLLLGVALATVPVAAVTAAPAQARACVKSGDIGYSAGVVYGSYEIYCNPPDVTSPLAVTIQRQSGTSWVTVAHGDANTGFATYHCSPSSMHTYRLLQAPHRKVNAPCV